MPQLIDFSGLGNLSTDIAKAKLLGSQLRESKRAESLQQALSGGTPVGEAVQQFGTSDQQIAVQQATQKQTNDEMNYKMRFQGDILKSIVGDLGAKGNFAELSSVLTTVFKDYPHLAELGVEMGDMEIAPDTVLKVYFDEDTSAPVNIVSNKNTGELLFHNGKKVTPGTTAEDLGLVGTAITTKFSQEREEIKTTETIKRLTGKRLADLRFKLPTIIRTDPQLKKSEDMKNTAIRLKELLRKDKFGKQDFKNALNIVSRQLARISGEQRLTDFDVKSFEGNPTIKRKIEQGWQTNFGEGTFTEFNVNEYRKIVEFLQDNADQMRKGVALRAARTAASQVTDEGIVTPENFDPLFNIAQETIGLKFDPSKLGIAAQVEAGGVMPGAEEAVTIRSIEEIKASPQDGDRLTNSSNQIAEYKEGTGWQIIK